MDLNFGFVLRQLRVESNLSQADLGDALGTSRSAISMYEAGMREPSFEMLDAIANYFNVDMNYLLGNSSKDTPFAAGKAIKSLRLSRGWSQEELGKKVGVNRAAVNKWETGRVQNLKRSTIAILSEVFDVSPAMLIGLSDTTTHYDDLLQEIKSFFGEPTQRAIELFLQLDAMDQGEIQGEMKQMLKAEKYSKQDEQLHA